MPLSLPVVAIAFSLVTLFCVGDIFIARERNRRFFRGFQAAAFAMAAAVYWHASATLAPIPSPNIRIVLILIAIITISEVISRWPWPLTSRGKDKHGSKR